MIPPQRPKKRPLLPPTMEGPILLVPETGAKTLTAEEMPSLLASPQPPRVLMSRRTCKSGADQGAAPKDSVLGNLRAPGELLTVLLETWVPTG